MIRKEIIFIFPILAAVISALTAAIGVTSVDAQNLTGNETGGNMSGENMTGVTVSGVINMTNFTEWKYDWYFVEFDHADNTIPNTIVRKQ